jgi:hypothetical protein
VRNINCQFARIDIFDEQRLVALLVIDEIVDLFFREQKAQATRPKALLFANGNVAKKIASRTVDGSMPKLFEREALTRILTRIATARLERMKEIST